MARMESAARPLNKKEVRLLRWAIGLRQRRHRKSAKRMATWGVTVFAFFWGITLVATRLDGKGPEWYLSGLIWLAILLPLLLWAYRDVRCDLARSVECFEGALRANTAHVFRIQSERFIELEEEEDEGACYAFELSSGRIVFVVGQEYYPSKRFPNSNFELVEIGGDEENSALEFIEKNGRKIAPFRTISADRKAQLRLPGHLEMLEGELDRMEDLLA